MCHHLRTSPEVPTGGVAVEPNSRHGMAQLGPPPVTAGTLTWILPFIIGSAVFITPVNAEKWHDTPRLLLLQLAGGRPSAPPP
jgi:hypothetical protein